MSIAKQSLDLDLQYTVWATQRLLDAASALNEEELSRDLGASHRSVIETLRHIYGSEEFWSVQLIAHQLPPLDEIGEPEPPSTVPPQVQLETLKQDWPKVWSSLNEWFEALSEEELAHEISTRLSASRQIHFTRWHLLRHMVNHATLHRGQIVGMLRALGKQPPNVDLIGYVIHSKTQ